MLSVNTHMRGLMGAGGVNHFQMRGVTTSSRPSPAASLQNYCFATIQCGGVGRRGLFAATLPVLDSVRKVGSHMPTDTQKDWFGTEAAGKSRANAGFSTSVMDSLAAKLSKSAAAAQEEESIKRSGESAGQTAAAMDRQNSESVGTSSSSANLPNLPGISQEELVEKLRQFEQLRKQESQQTANVERSRRLKEIDQMRRSLPPKKFKQFLADLEKMDVKSQAEMDKLAAMSPQELFRYQRSKRWWHELWENVNFALIVLSALGTFFIFYYLLIEFFVV